VTYLGGSLAGMTADRNLWKNRADQAWGRSRSWSGGLSWESEYNTSQAALASMTADRDAWINNYNQAIASRDYWQHTVAHNDANVWDNRYNAGYSAGNSAGYAAGAASKTTSAVGTGTSGTGGLPGWPSTSGDLGSVTCPRTGLAHISFRTGSNGDDAAVHVFRNGALAIEGASANGGLNTTFAVQGNLNVNAGDTISVRASGSGDSGLQGGYLLVTVGSQ
jgi:hypothetical protein